MYLFRKELQNVLFEIEVKVECFIRLNKVCTFYLKTNQDYIIKLPGKQRQYF